MMLRVSERSVELLRELYGAVARGDFKQPQAFDPAIRVALEAMTAGQLEPLFEARRGSVRGADGGEEKR